MQKKLDEYIKIYDNFLSNEICEKTIEELKFCNWQQHSFYNSRSGESKSLSGNKELETYFGDISTKKQIMQKIWDSYLQYTKDLNFFWFNSWEGFTDVRFNRYLENTIMAKHCDHINNMFDGNRKGIPTLTALGLLNDNFDGGEFVMFDDDVINLKKGSIIVFPSVFLYPHKVNPVINGIRYSFVTWAW